MKSITGFTAEDITTLRQLIGAYVWERTNKKLTWVDTEHKLVLAARMTTQHHGWEISVSESDLVPVQEWCEKNNCGKRISFDQFRFRSKKEMTLFLLRWT